MQRQAVIGRKNNQYGFYDESNKQFFVIPASSD
jgi:hypothetical protein